MDPKTGILVLLINIGAGFVQRGREFGLGILAMMFLPYVMPTRTVAATLSSIMSCATAISNAICYRMNVRYKIAWSMILAAMNTVPIAVYFSGRCLQSCFRSCLAA